MAQHVGVGASIYAYRIADMLFDAGDFMSPASPPLRKIFSGKQKLEIDVFYLDMPTLSLDDYIHQKRRISRKNHRIEMGRKIIKDREDIFFFDAGRCDRYAISLLYHFSTGVYREHARNPGTHRKSNNHERALFFCDTEYISEDNLMNISSAFFLLDTARPVKGLSG